MLRMAISYFLENVNIYSQATNVLYWPIYDQKNKQINKWIKIATLCITQFSLKTS